MIESSISVTRSQQATSTILELIPEKSFPDEGPLYNYIPLKEYAEIHGANPANVRQKILRGTLPAKKIGSEWFIDINTPYTDARRKEGES